MTAIQWSKDSIPLTVVEQSYEDVMLRDTYHTVRWYCPVWALVDQVDTVVKFNSNECSEDIFKALTAARADPRSVKLKVAYH